VSGVLETAGQGILRLGMRLYAFEVSGDDLVLRHLATARSRLMAIEHQIGRPLIGLRAPFASVPLVDEVVRGGRVVHRDDLDVLHSFMRVATGFDATALENSPDTASINNGVLAPIFVREKPWGLLGVVSSALARNDADAVALFATHVGSALEVAETIEALERLASELAACHEDLGRAQKGLVERERFAALGELAAVVAHEARNPLCVLFNSIGSLREYLRAGAPEQRSADAALYASMAAEEADHLNCIVSDLLEFARPHPPQLRDSSLVPVLESLAVATAPDGRVCVEIDSGLPLVQIDPLFLQRALLNLVLNALQATGKDGTVRVHASTKEHDGARFLRIDVTDDGLGIPADVRASIFDPFFTTKPSCTGLGLAVVKQIVDSHGAELSVSSGAAGTTFTMMLPALVR
jgi:signal transduction histidine kinase